MESEDLARKAATIDKVTVEKITIGLRREAVELEDVEEVVVLAVRVAADGNTGSVALHGDLKPQISKNQKQY